MAMLTVRARQFLQRTRRNLGANGPTSMGFDMSKVECYNYHRKGHFARECRSPKDTKRNGAVEPQRRNVPVETSTSNALVHNVMVPVTAVVPKPHVTRPRQAKIVVTKSHSPPRRHINHSPSPKASTFPLKVTAVVAPMVNAVKGNWMCDKKNNVLFIDTKCLVLSPEYQSGDRYHAVPPPYTGTFMPPKHELAFHNAPNDNETIHTAFNVELSPTQPDNDLSHTHRPSAPIIEDWVSDSEEDFEDEISQNAPSIPKPKSNGNRRKRKACFVCKSLDHLIKDLLTKSKLVPITAVRRVTAAVPKPLGNPKHALKDKRVIDSGCSRHMTRNMSYLSDFKELNSRYVAFGGNLKGGKISGKENKPNVAGSGPTWLFDIGTLTRTIHYQQVTAEFEDLSNNSINEINAADSSVYAVGQISTNNTNTFSAAGPSNATVSPTHGKSSYMDTSQFLNDPNMPELEDITYSDDKEDVGAEADFTNLKITITDELLQFKMQKVWVLVDLPHGKRAIGHTQDEGINYEEVFAPVARIEAIRLFLAYASFMGFMVYQMDVKSAFLYVTIKEEVYVCQPLGFEDPDHLDKVYKVVKALYGLHQAPRAWQKGDILLVQIYVDDIIFGSTNKDLCKDFEKLMKDKFQMSSKGELTFFLGLQVKQKRDGIFVSQDKYVVEILKKFSLTDGKSASTPIDTDKPLLKDPDGEDVDVHTYRSMIGSLMYLTSSRPDIMFAVVLSSMKSLKWMLHVTNILSAGYITTLQMVLNSPCLTHIKNWLVQIKRSLVNDVTRLQALVDKKKVLITEATIRDALRLDDAEGIDCLPNEEIFAELSRMGVGKGISGVDTPLFEGMIVVQQVDESAAEGNVLDAGIADEGAANVNADAVLTTANEPIISSLTPTTPPPPPSQDVPSTLQVQPTLPPSLIVQPPSPQQQPQPLQDAKISMDLFHNLLDTCTTLTRRVKNLEQDKIGRIIASMDVDVDVTLKDVVDIAKEVTVDVDIKVSADVQRRRAEFQAQIYQIDLEQADKVLSIATITVLALTLTTAVALTLTTTPSAARRRKGVVIRDPKETATPSTIIHTKAKSKDKGKGILVKEPKPLNKQAQIEQDEAFARELEAELNKTINWDDVIDQVQRKEKEDNDVMRYHELKRKPQTEAQARKNMMIYLRNMAGFKMDYFKRMKYDEIRLIFDKYFNFNVAFSEKAKEQIEEEDNIALKRISESQEDKAAKKQKLDEEATPLAHKVPVVDYTIHTENNKPYFKIIRADGTHQLFLSFLSLLRNFDQEDLEVLWELVKERFASSKPKNFSDDLLLTTLTYMFEKPGVQAQVWKNQRTVYGLAKREDIHSQGSLWIKCSTIFGVDAAEDFKEKYAN
nr:putative ribonuclease H-like domain-containing protein [Tanacetum cinerariifolium]